MEIRRCQLHDEYYVKTDESDPHKDCKSMDDRAIANGGTFKLEWVEVVYYLNKLRQLKKLFNQLRIELL